MDIQAKIIDTFDRVSDSYDLHTGNGMPTARERAAWIAALRSLLPPPPVDVLDIGTGTGSIALLLAELGYHVRGIDLSERMLAQARRRAAAAGINARLDLGDAAAPPVGPASIDVVVSRHLLHLLLEPDRALAAWFHLLRQGGRAVIIDGLWGQDPDDIIKPDVQAALPLRAPGATLDDVRRLVEAAGFVDVTLGTLDDIDRIEHELAIDAEPAPNIPRYVVVGRKPT